MADYLCEENERPLELICEESGFSSIQYASKVFKSLFHMTLGKYREYYHMGRLRVITKHAELKQENLFIHKEIDIGLLKAYTNQDVSKIEKNIIKGNLIEQYYQFLYSMK